MEEIQDENNESSNEKRIDIINDEINIDDLTYYPNLRSTRPSKPLKMCSNLITKYSLMSFDKPQ